MYKTDRSIDQYKTRLVAKGYIQIYGIDYQKTFSPIAKLDIVKVLLSLVANLNWLLHHFDVKIVFFYGDIEVEVYEDIPPRYIASPNGNIICRLQKTFYGLK